MAIKKLKKSLKRTITKRHKNVEEDIDDFEFSESESEEPKLNVKQLTRKRNLKAANNLSESDEDSEQPKKKQLIKKRKLEVASDQEDSEDDDGEENSKIKSGKIKVTLKMVKKWERLARENIHEALKELGDAFRAAMQSNETNTENFQPTKYIVKGNIISDAIVNACMVELIPALANHLTLPEPTPENKVVLPSKSSKWKKVKNLVKEYLVDVLKLIDQMSCAKSIGTVMKHVFQLTPMFACFQKLVRPFVEKLVNLWSSSGDTVRIQCFRCLFIMIHTMEDKAVKFTYMKLYLMAMKNSQFTTVNSLPAINYMKSSLIDLYCLKPAIAYDCIFRSLKQVSMYLMGVVNNKKNKKVQIINWRFCHSLSIFADFIGRVKDDENVQKLVHVVSTIILGTINIYQSPCYIPMWLFNARILIQLMEQTGKFIQILPTILEPLKTKLFDKTPKAGKMKSCIFSVCLRMNKKELKEKAFLDEAVDEIFELLVTYTSSLAHKVTLPELIMRDMLTLKEYVKASKAQIYVKKFKQAIEKIQKRCSEIEKIRNSKSIDLKDLEAVAEWEDKLKEEGSDLKKFCDCWIKTRQKVLELQASNKDEICTDDLPIITRPEPRKATDEDRERFKSLFKFGDDDDEEGSDDDDDDEHEADVARFQDKEGKPVKKSKKIVKLKTSKTKTKKDDDDDDDYSDFDEDELERLARSPTSGDDEDDDDDDDEVDLDGYDNDDPDIVKELNLDEEDEDDGSDDDDDDDDNDDDDDDDNDDDDDDDDNDDDDDDDDE